MRRLISLDVVDTDAFLDMPVSSQLLYFHLNTRADDDGFIASPRKIMRMIGVQQDDLRVLAGKKFVIPFEDGVCVIKHWRINNLIRKDRYTPTKYLEHKKRLYVRANGAYTETNDERALPVPDGFFSVDKLFEAGLLEVGNQLATKRRPKVSKVKLSKVKLSKDNTHTLTLFDLFWSEYPNKKAKAKARAKYIALVGADPTLHDKIMEGLKKYKKTKQWNEAGGKFIPHPTTWLNQERWTDEISEAEIKSNDVIKI